MIRLGPSYIIKCPKCGNPHPKCGWASYSPGFSMYANAPGISKQRADSVPARHPTTSRRRKIYSTPTLWTDGIVTGFMMFPIECPFTRCTYATGKGKCDEIFWTDDAEVVREMKGFGAFLGLPKDDCNVCDCYEALKRGVAGRNRDRQLWLRKFSWEQTLDPIRELPYMSFPIGTRVDPSAEHLDNLMRIAELFDHDKPHERLMAVEAFRQAGKFKEAKDLLSFPWPEGLKHAADFIGSLIDEGDMIVRMIPESDR
jgi:hypothetical protein